jgi:hypothetical protein
VQADVIGSGDGGDGRGADAARLAIDPYPVTSNRPLPDDHSAAALWCRILDQLPLQEPNQDPAIPKTLAATRRTTTTSHD